MSTAAPDTDKALEEFRKKVEEVTAQEGEPLDKVKALLGEITRTKEDASPEEKELTTRAFLKTKNAAEKTVAVDHDDEVLSPIQQRCYEIAFKLIVVKQSFPDIDASEFQNSLEKHAASLPYRRLAEHYIFNKGPDEEYVLPKITAKEQFRIVELLPPQYQTQLAQLVQNIALEKGMNRHSHAWNVFKIDEYLKTDSVVQEVLDTQTHGIRWKGLQPIQLDSNAHPACRELMTSIVDAINQAEFRIDSTMLENGHEPTTLHIPNDAVMEAIGLAEPIRMTGKSSTLQKFRSA